LNHASTAHSTSRGKDVSIAARCVVVSVEESSMQIMDRVGVLSWAVATSFRTVVPVPVLLVTTFQPTGGIMPSSKSALASAAG
jgi:hypothetical protein